MSMDHDPLPGDHPETERVSTGVLPPDTDVQALISAGYERYRHLGEGAVADYIPALAAASPSAFGVCVAGVGGRLFSAGDADQEFAIESISKLFVFALVCHTLGHEQARQKLGVNSTGLPFNSVMAIELNTDRTMNPLVNAGAMATTSLVPGTTADEKFESIVAAMSRFAGRRLVMDEDVYESEAATNDRNPGNRPPPGRLWPYVLRPRSRHRRLHPPVFSARQRTGPCRDGSHAGQWRSESGHR
jgi:glutaminase